jgi:hypothetical protein
MRTGANHGAETLKSHALGFLALAALLAAATPAAHASQYYWETGEGPGSRHYWQSGDGPLSRHFWEHAESQGSRHFWTYGRTASFGPLMTALCASGMLEIELCEPMRQADDAHYTVVILAGCGLTAQFLRGTRRASAGYFRC